jgi:predicted permease
MEQFRRELLLAVRRLIAAPAFTLFSIVTLALGVGATTSIYSVVHALLRPPDIRAIDRVVNVYHSDFAHDGGAARSFIALSWPDYEDLRNTQTVFDEVTAWARFRQTIVGGGSGQAILGEMVGGEYFHLLGIEPAIGRLIQPADDRANAPLVIVLSDGLWRQQFCGVDMPAVMPTAAWVPLSGAEGLGGSGMGYDAADRESRWLMVKGRVRPGRTVAQAQAEMAAIGQRLDRAYPLGRDFRPNTHLSPYVQRAWYVMPAADLRMHESVHHLAGIFATAILIAVGLVLLVACTNLANLLLACGASRRHEMAVRLALGASRTRLVLEYLVESALVAVAGGLAALAVAWLLVDNVLTASIHAAPGATIHLSPELDLPVFPAAGAATLVALVVFGVVPALHLSRVSVRDTLSIDSSASGVPRWRARRTLIACQVGVSVALVALAAAAGEQVASAARRDTGLDLDRIALVRFDFKVQRQDEQQARKTLTAIAAVVRRQPGVDAVALASGLPVGTETPGAWLTVDGDTKSRGAELLTSSPAVFRTLGVSVVHGRPIDERDVQGALPVAVVSELTARALFGRGNAIGRIVLVQRNRWAGESEQPIQTRTIVGVAADTDAGSVGRRDHGIVYLPFAQHYEPAMSVIARTSGDPDALVRVLRTTANRVDPELAVVDAGTGTSLGGASNIALAIMSGTAGLLGLLALLLAMAGLYGVLTHAVAGRTREIGLRVALGASRARLIVMVLADGIWPVLGGLFIGLATGALARMAMRPLFVRLCPALDPLVLAAVPIAFLIAALIACYFPARRAARVDPNVALRHL